MQADSPIDAFYPSGRRPGETALHHWYRKNAEWLYLALALAICGALWVDASNQRIVSALVATFNIDHKSACSTQRARLQTVLNFWSDTSGYRESHAAHELDASVRWAIIDRDLQRERVGDAQLRADISSVSRKWRELAADDYGNAERSRKHVRDLQGEYDHTCGDTAPTPHPVSDVSLHD